MLECPICKQQMTMVSVSKGKAKFVCNRENIEHKKIGCGNVIYMQSKFKKMEKVRLIKSDAFKKYIGKIFIVSDIIFTQGIISYSIFNEEDHIAWIYEPQLELVKPKEA